MDFPEDRRTIERVGNALVPGNIFDARKRSEHLSASSRRHATRASTLVVRPVRRAIVSTSDLFGHLFRGRSRVARDRLWRITDRTTYRLSLANIRYVNREGDCALRSYERSSEVHSVRFFFVTIAERIANAVCVFSNTFDEKDVYHTRRRRSRGGGDDISFFFLRITKYIYYETRDVRTRIEPTANVSNSMLEKLCTKAGSGDSSRR